MFLSVILFAFAVVCLMVFVNCWLNAFAMFDGVVAVLFAKVMVLFGVWMGFLFPNP